MYGICPKFLVYLYYTYAFFNKLKGAKKMVTGQRITAGNQGDKNKTVRNIQVFSEPGEPQEMALKRFKKLYNITDEELTSGKVKIKIYDPDKMFPTSRTYKKKSQ